MADYPFNKAESLLIDASNALGEDADPRATDADVKAVQNKIDEALRLVQAITHQRYEPRDEAYERAAARYDGTGKDWR